MSTSFFNHESRILSCKRTRIDLIGGQVIFAIKHKGYERTCLDGGSGQAIRRGGNPIWSWFVSIYRKALWMALAVQCIRCPACGFVRHDSPEGLTAI
jgi:hypothetical protein